MASFWRHMKVLSTFSLSHVSTRLMYFQSYIQKTAKMDKLFTKIVSSLELLSIFAKNSISDVWLGSE